MKLITSSKTIDMSSYGVHCLTPHIGSLELVHTTEKFDGRDGNILLGSTYNSRIITAEFVVISRDRIDLDFIRNDLYSLFAKKEEFYIVFDRDPKKRWKVILNKPFEVERVNAVTGKFSLEFICCMPYSESVGRTIDPLTFDSNLWQVHQGLNFEKPSYIHSTNDFRIYNAGDVTLDPRELPLTIIFKGTSTNLTIRNITTGDVWSYTGNTTSADTINLTGIRPLKNNLSIFKNTNRKLISIASGWNDFKITGATDFTISFDFRFYYL